MRCSFGAAPAAATATASFPIHSNKQDGCRYAAALPAAQILGSNRQDVYGQKWYLCACATSLGPRRSDAGALTISFSLDPALWLCSPELSKRKGDSLARGSSSAADEADSARAALASGMNIWVYL